MFSAGKWTIIIIYWLLLLSVVAIIGGVDNKTKYEYGAAIISLIVAIILSIVTVTVEFFENTEDKKEKKY